MRKQACGLFTLVVFFSKSQWRRSIPRYSFGSDVGSVIRCRLQNLYQQQTIIVNLGECLQGAASRCGALFFTSRLLQIVPFLYFSSFFMCLCVFRGCVWRALRVAERSSGCHRGVLLCEAGASLINVCWCRGCNDARALLLFTAVLVHRSESAACKWHYCPWWMSIRVNSF